MSPSQRAIAKRKVWDHVPQPKPKKKRRKRPVQSDRWTGPLPPLVRYTLTPEDVWRNPGR